MRFVSFMEGGLRGLALEMDDGSLRGVTENDPSYPGDLDTLVRNDGLMEAAAALSNASLLDPSDIVHDLPFRKAGKILCVGLNYLDHAAETKITVPDFPTVFVRFNEKLVAHDQPIVRPASSSMLDYEGELAVVIGKAGRKISQENAVDYIAGYSIFNDTTVRDYQFKSSQWTIGKNFDHTGSFGPVFVTEEELPKAGHSLRIQTRLNGEIMQDASTSDLIFKVPDLISLLSIGMTLEPGDIIVTGTPSGVGMAREPQVFLKPGDVCEVEIEKIGLLRNTVVDEVA